MKITKQYIESIIKFNGTNYDLAAQKIYDKIQEEFEELQERDEFLSKLEAAGVDNWEGYGFAVTL